jgi:hypothetical protein
MEKIYSFIVNGISYLAIFTGFTAIFLGLLIALDYLIILIVKYFKAYHALFEFIFERSRKKHKKN